MWIWLTFSLVATLLLAILFIRRYIDYREVSLPLLATLTLSIYLPLSIVFLLPLDIYNGGSESEGKIIYRMWQLNYWLTFLLTWALLPFFQYYTRSGYYDAKDKATDSINKLIRYQLALLTVGFSILAYCLLTGKFKLKSLKSIVITCSHIYSLTIALWMMSHGLISIPKSIYRRSSVDVNQLYLKIPSLSTSKHDHLLNYKDVCYKIMKYPRNPENSEWLDSLIDKIPASIRTESNHSVLIDGADSESLVKLSENLSIYKHKYLEALNQFSETMDEALKWEEILDSKNSGSSVLIFQHQPDHIFNKFPRFNYVYYNHLRYHVHVLAGVLSLLISMVIVQSETFHSTRASLLKYIINLNFHTRLNSVTVFCFLSYMVVVTLLTLTQVKVFNIYKISPHGNSNPSSFIFFLTYASRLTIPLSYNFTMLLSNDSSQFQKFLGESIKLIKAGEVINDILPRLIIVPIILELYNVYGKLNQWIRNILFLDDDFDLQFDESEPLNRDDSIIARSKQIIERELRVRQAHV
ncbi:hypothetical protein PP7435_CHR1-0595 [Komagataella phaffii CBS 7435]|uniref:Uncharacterized protein n=2 Tax=Komagataella phaffii TaxID=460519 RepID=C4QWM7_KOMPG|nr:Hypothetical protein PAS_chr1-1_0278 [Komagataella phaffii GS115]AOA60906.1 GQ67_02860T0 [Komagataella phaffii]CAH2446384.1 hypothetical protein BQ9382_C1-3060 [Komagataella phaffii CBS 7435]AOA65848.1 GQ68_02387T0 [Komagataella phaffii GS115]CAY67650.1 Hypothetical protein PAS_chr1-1_0278 [Komagataella phaffii GS115]CCA36744.1 hypothetical protein PP7435_CHR1-0595 [Komagataella phaffii CBS 7435]